MDNDQKQNTERSTQNQSQGSKGNEQPKESNVNQDQQLHTEDLPDSTNESQGNTGSGQRQDSN
jgi:hypothetical protein